MISSVVRCSVAAIRLNVYVHVYVYVYVSTLSSLEHHNRAVPSLFHFLRYPPLLSCPVLSLTSPLPYPFSSLILILVLSLNSFYSIAHHSIVFTPLPCPPSSRRGLPDLIYHVSSSDCKHLCLCLCLCYRHESNRGRLLLPLLLAQLTDSDMLPPHHTLPCLCPLLFSTPLYSTLLMLYNSPCFALFWQLYHHSFIFPLLPISIILHVVPPPPSSIFLCTIFFLYLLILTLSPLHTHSHTTQTEC